MHAEKPPKFRPKNSTRISAWWIQINLVSDSEAEVKIRASPRNFVVQGQKDRQERHKQPSMSLLAIPRYMGDDDEDSDNSSSSSSSSGSESESESGSDSDAEIEKMLKKQKKQKKKRKPDTDLDNDSSSKKQKQTDTATEKIEEKTEETEKDVASEEKAKKKKKKNKKKKKKVAPEEEKDPNYIICEDCEERVSVEWRVSGPFLQLCVHNREECNACDQSAVFYILVFFHPYVHKMYIHAHTHT